MDTAVLSAWTPGEVAVGELARGCPRLVDRLGWV